jgi:peptide/nickel transport system substrate-binding protein
LCAEAKVPRRIVLALAAVCGAALLPTRALAAGRLPVGAKIALRIPWPLSSIDPHRIDDAAAAILGPALFEALYALDDAGAPVPWLAEALPEPSGSRLVVALRGGLTSALGQSLGAKDAAYSLARASASGAHGWLAEVGLPKIDSPSALSFATRDASKLARVLASPVTAIVPRNFVPERPDGTGPFRAERREEALVLRRNEAASSGPALLDEIDVRSAPDLAASLSAFESGVDDMGWLGSGLHEPRPGAKSFDAGACAWAILRTGTTAGTWDAPGVAQRICDGIAPSRLSYLALGSPWAALADDGWGGAPCELLVRDDAPWLRELARAVAASIGRPSHEVTPRPVSPAELVARRASRSFSLSLDVVRPLAPGTLGTLVALATSDDPAGAADVMRHPPRAEASARVLCRTLRVGVLGDVRIQGGRAPDLTMVLGPGRVEFGSLTRIAAPAGARAQGATR